MLISSKSEYGLRALMDIAVNEQGAPVTRSDIAQRQQIPLPYLTQVLRALVNGGLLKSNRGPAGGYSLGKDTADIGGLDVVTLLQGPVAPTGCAGAGAAGECQRLAGCGLVGVWNDLKDSSENVLGQTSLKDILSRGAAPETSAADDEAAEKLDCIGVPCPLPIVHIAETMRRLDTGEVLEVWADDEGAKADIPAWCMGTGNDFIGREEFGDQMKFLIRKVV
jgi:Rrf2 family protein